MATMRKATTADAYVMLGFIWVSRSISEGVAVVDTVAAFSSDDLVEAESPEGVVGWWMLLLWVRTQCCSSSLICSSRDCFFSGAISFFRLSAKIRSEDSEPGVILSALSGICKELGADPGDSSSFSSVGGAAVTPCIARETETSSELSLEAIGAFSTTFSVSLSVTMSLLASVLVWPGTSTGNSEISQAKQIVN